MRKLALLTGILAGLSLVASADPLDPDILIDAAADPGIPYSQLSTLVPGQGTVCGGTVTDPSYCFEIFNDTNSMITAFQFSVDIPGLVNNGGVIETPDALFQFTCPPGGGPFFKACQTSYSGDTLTFSYSGVNVDTSHVPEPCDEEVGEKEGIPIANACESNPNVGYVIIQLDGWNGSANGVDLSQVAISTVPEPGVLSLFGIGLALAWKRRKQARV